MTVVLLLVVQRVLFALVAVAIVLVMFTALQFNLQGAGLMALLAVAAYVAARAVGWVLARFLGNSQREER